MNPQYIRALHIIFVVTWFSGMFYIVRLFIYNREAQDKNEPEKTILSNQFNLMIKRLWLGITMPSAVLTLVFGVWMMKLFGYLDYQPTWFLLKILFVIGLYAYHFSLHKIYKEQQKGVFKYSSSQLRIWNEVATIFLLAIVMLVEVQQGMSLVYGAIGLLLFIVIIMLSIKVYKRIREK